MLRSIAAISASVLFNMASLSFADNVFPPVLGPIGSSENIDTSVVAVGNALGNQRLCDRRLSRGAALFCSSGASRICAARGQAGGWMTEFDSGRGIVSIGCAPGGREQVAISTLTSIHSGCTAWWSASSDMSCTSAAHQYCQSLGYVGGLVQEFDSVRGSADLLCVNGTEEHLSLSQLELEAFGRTGVCSANNNWTWLTCNSAASRYCNRVLGMTTGFIQERTASETVIVCAP